MKAPVIFQKWVGYRLQTIQTGTGGGEIVFIRSMIKARTGRHVWSWQVNVQRKAEVIKEKKKGRQEVERLGRKS